MYLPTYGEEGVAGFAYIATSVRHSGLACEELLVSSAFCSYT